MTTALTTNLNICPFAAIDRPIRPEITHNWRSYAVLSLYDLQIAKRKKEPVVLDRFFNIDTYGQVVSLRNRLSTGILVIAAAGG